MEQATVKKILIGAGIALLLISLSNMFGPIASVLQVFLANEEGFISYPKWDYKQWSWGYGTRVPGSIDDPGSNPGGTINKVQAMQELLKFVQADYTFLKPRVITTLTTNQWSALLSFAYNEGTGSAQKLLPQINARDFVNLEGHWKQYVYAGGVVDDDLVARRNREWQLFLS